MCQMMSKSSRQDHHHPHCAIEDTQHKKLKILRLISGTWRSPWALCVVAWCYLTLTQPAGLMWFDSGELALAAHSWGLGHPPGQPFFQILGVLTTYLPYPLWTLNHISVLSIALSIPALSILWHALHPSDEPPATEPLRLSGIEWTLGLCWVMTYPVWDQGARVEVYGLGLALGLWSLALLHHMHRTQKHWVTSGLLLGLCGATQPIFAIGFGLASVIKFVTEDSERRWSMRRDHVIGVLLGFLTPHLYLWWAVEHSTGFIWGNWDSWTSAVDYFRGRDYRLNHYTWSSVTDNLIAWLQWANQRGHLLWCILSLAGVAWARSITLVWWLIPTTLFGAFFPLAYQNYDPAVPDFSGYQLPTLALSLLGMWALAARLSRVHQSQGRAWMVCIAVAFHLSWGMPNPWSRGRHQHHLPQTIAQHWLEALPPNALLLVESDHWVFPLMYVQHIRHVRPDIVVFNTGFARSTWYWRWHKRLHPEFPSLEEVSPKRTHQPRIMTLAQKYGAVYTESAQLAEVLSQPLSPSPIISRACASGWGMNVRCEHPTPTPSIEDLKRWARLPAHHDPITQRVIARLGLDLTAHLWRDQKPHQAIQTGYATLGESLPDHHLTSIQWWPAPSTLWVASRQGLIGDPVLLRATLEGLTGSASD